MTTTKQKSYAERMVHQVRANIIRGQPTYRIAAIASEADAEIARLREARATARAAALEDAAKLVEDSDWTPDHDNRWKLAQGIRKLAESPSPSPSPCSPPPAS